MVESLKKVVKDSKSFRMVAVKQSASLIPNNIVSHNGSTFAVIKNSEKGGTINIYGDDILNNKTESATPAVNIESASDYVFADFLIVKDQTYMAVCTMA